MNRETFKTQLSELFPGEKLNIVWVEETNAAKVKFNRELTRLELGHLFSLGIERIKRSGEGLSISLLLENASLNQIYTPQTK
jgi:hypothetical protein